jgi:hypothetical protein
LRSRTVHRFFLRTVANAPAAAEALNHFKNWSPPNQACLHVDLRALRCEWSRNMPLLGLPQGPRAGLFSV